MDENRQPHLPVKHRLLAALFVSFAALTSISGVAYADETEPGNPDKAGRVMLNVRAGLAFGMVNAERDLRLLGTAGIDFGVALSSHYNAYLVLTPQVDLRTGFFNIMVPLGFQYDIRLGRGLYLYPRVSLGYAAMISNPSVDVGSLQISATDITHGGVGIPEVGIKYIVNGRLNLGFEPVSVPIFFTSNSYAVWYRVLGLIGGTF